MTALRPGRFLTRFWAGRRLAVLRWGSLVLLVTVTAACNDYRNSAPIITVAPPGDPVMVWSESLSTFNSGEELKAALDEAGFRTWRLSGPIPGLESEVWNLEFSGDVHGVSIEIMADPARVQQRLVEYYSLGASVPVVVGANWLMTAGSADRAQAVAAALGGVVQPW